MLWMEENNLQFQNVSGKDISSAVLNIVMTDHRGNQFLHVRKLGIHTGWSSFSRRRTNQMAAYTFPVPTR